MAGFHRDENSMTCSADFIVRDQFAFDDRACVGGFRDARDELQWAIGRRRAQQFDRVFRGDGAWRFVRTLLVHQVPRCRPVTVTIQQRADDSAAQHASVCFVLDTRVPLGDDLFAVRKTANVQALRIGRTTTEAREIWCER